MYFFDGIMYYTYGTCIMHIVWVDVTKFSILQLSHNDYFKEKMKIFGSLSINRVVQDRKEKRDFSKVCPNFASFDS